MQEQVLSARFLVFTSEGLYWECAQMSASEFHPHGSQNQYTRSLSSRDPESYGGEIFLPSDQTYAQMFKCSLLNDAEFFVDSASTEAVRFIRSLMPLAKDALRSEVAALRQAPGYEAPGTSWVIEQMQVFRRHRTQPARCQQNLEVEEKHDKLTGSTPQPSSPQPARAGLGEGSNITTQTRIWHYLVTD